MHFVDLNGDGIINESDKTIIGNPNPKLYGNFFAHATWGNLTLSAIFGYSIGNDIYNYQRSILESGNNFYNQTSAMTDRWRVEGQVTNMPRISYGDEMGNSRFSDRWIEDGSYLKLRSLNINYKIPVNSSWLRDFRYGQRQTTSSPSASILAEIQRCLYPMQCFTKALTQVAYHKVAPSLSA